jgi:hypothetical protein
MQKKVLSEQAIYYKRKYTWSKDFDKLNSYIKDFIKLNYKLNLVNKDCWTNIFVPNETTELQTNVDPVNLKNSPDFTFLYGINTVDCDIKILYDDNRRKGRSWTIPLTENKFVMFPSTNMYSITNKQKDSLNFIQTITYEYL